MIYFNINIRNPGWVERYRNIKYWHFETPFKHKFIELQVIKNDNLLRFEFEFTIRQDHAGVVVEFGLLGYEIHFSYYDHRHWDYENNCWHGF